jgi:2-aminoadipate transaminase
MTPISAEITNFIVGQPGEALIPFKLLNQFIAGAVQKNTDPFIFQYPTIEGPVPFRQSLSQLLLKSGLFPAKIHPDNICTSFGNSSAISLAIQSLSRPGDSVLVEDPTYFLIGDIFRSCHLNVIPCRVGSDSGIDVERLESLVRSQRPRFLYVNPIHHNPTGSCLSVKDREKLIRLSVEYDFIIFSDEPYVFLSFDSSNTYESLSSLAVTASRIAGADYKNLLCFGSFSKILAPGLRCGWISGHPETMKKITSNGSLQSGGGPAPIITETIRSLIDSGELMKHIEALQLVLYERAHSMMNAIKRHLGETHTTYHVPLGGYFVYVRFLDDRVDTRTLQKFLDDNGYSIKFLSGARCRAVKDLEAPYEMTKQMRLAFSFYTSEEIERGIETLSRGYFEYLNSL